MRKTSRTSRLTLNQKAKTPSRARQQRVAMSSKQPIAYIDVRASAHATEDQLKVQAAIQNLLSPVEPPSPIAFHKTNCLGHYGNPIVLFTAKLTEKNEISLILERIGSRLSSLDRQDFSDNLALHQYKTNLYLRFDKQAAFQNLVKFSSTDPIHLRIHFKGITQDQIAEFLKQKGLLP
jgi:RNA binding exosome subunit